VVEGGGGWGERGEDEGYRYGVVRKEGMGGREGRVV